MEKPMVKRSNQHLEELKCRSEGPGMIEELCGPKRRGIKTIDKG